MDDPFLNPNGELSVTREFGHVQIKVDVPLDALFVYFLEYWSEGDRSERFWAIVIRFAWFR